MIRRHAFRRSLQERNIESARVGNFGADAVLTLYKGAKEPYTVVATLEDYWHIQQLTDEATGAEYFKCWVVDRDGTRRDKLREATVFLQGRTYYKKLAPDPPLGLTRVYDFRVQPVGFVAAASASISPSASASASPSA